MQLEGTVALVTGGSSGIGAATADQLAAAGSWPLLVGRDASRLDAVAERTRGAVIRSDLATPGGPQEVAARALEIAGRVDVLVNNAGVGWAGSLTAMAGEDISTMVGVNLLAPLRLTHLLAAGMVARGRGHVVNVSSIAGATGVREEAVYSATKAGLATFADAVRADLAGTGVGVSVVVPGVVDTPFFEMRGVPYGRRWPRPLPPERLASAIVDAIRRDRVEVFVPRWTRLPARLRGGLPTLYRTLAARFG